MKRSSQGSRGFTLVELLVAMTVLTVLAGVIFSILGGMTDIWRRSASKIQAFQEARAGFESLTRKLSQATLNTYSDYEYDANGKPVRYARQSELAIVFGAGQTLVGTASPARPTHGVFFHAPIGFAGSSGQNYSQLHKLLNACGFFLEFGSDSLDRPDFLNSGSRVAERWRYRLKELWQPAENLTIYSLTSGNPQWPSGAAVGNEWFAPALLASPASSRVLAENIIALVLLPCLPEREDYNGTALAPQYTYDSRRSFAYQGHDKTGAVLNSGNIKHQLPPLVHVVMVTLDEASAMRLAARCGTAPPDLGLGALFSDASKLQADLAVLEARLVSERLTYRVFSTYVSIEGAKWSND